MNIAIRPSVPADAEACGRISYEAFKDIRERHGFPPHFSTVEIAIERAASVAARRCGDEFRAVVISVAGKTSKAFSLVLKRRISCGIANDVDGDGGVSGSRWLLYAVHSLLKPLEIPMASLTKLRLIQFRAGYNLPVHAGREQGIFERHGLEIEITYTPGSLYISDALRKGNSRLATRAPTISSPMWKISAAVLRASLSSWDSIAAS